MLAAELKLTKEAWLITKSHKLLWFFGIFLSGLGWIVIILLTKEWVEQQEIINALWHVITNPMELLHMSVGFLLLGLLLLAFPSVSLVILARVVYEHREHMHELRPLNKQFWRSLFRLSRTIYIVSALTSVCMGFIVWVLFVPLLWIQGNAAEWKFYTQLGFGVLAWLSFLVSCVNIFAWNFVIKYNLPSIRAIKLAVDVVKMKWVQILKLGVGLSILQAGLVGLGSGLSLGMLYGLSWFVNITPIWQRLFSGTVIAFLIIVYSVFFNIYITLFFMDTMGEVKSGNVANKIRLSTVIEKI